MAEIDRLEVKVEAQARNANRQLDTLISRLSTLRSSLSGINGSGLIGLSNGVKNLSTAMHGMKNVKTSDFSRLTRNIEKLGHMNTSNLSKSASAMYQLTKAFNGLGTVSGNAQKVGELAKNIGKLGNKGATNAVENIPKLAQSLKKMMQTLSTAPRVSSNLVKMTSALASLSRNGNKLGTTSRSIMNGFKIHSSSARGAEKSTRSLASAIGKLYATYFLLFRAIKWVGSGIKSATDYIEEYNFYSVAMGKIASEWSKDYKKYGYDSAEEYGNSFSSRLTEIIGKMSGFKMNDNGTLTDLNKKNLGLDITGITNYTANIAQLTNSLGMCGEASVVTSKALAMIATDQASYMNLSESEAMENFSSGIIGQSRALYRYGIDITNATLQQIAYDHGVSKSVKNMTQAEKMQLRLLAILQQSKVAYGDLANTINSPSNQLKILKNNFKSLARTIGNIFLPVVATVLPYINGLVIAIRRLFEWIGSLVGVDLSKVIGNSTAGYNDTFADVSDDADDASDSIGNVAKNTDKATKAAKKYQNQILGFDEITKLDDTSDSSSNSSPSSGPSGSGSPIDLTDDMSKALNDYQKVWDAAFKGMNNKANKIADDIVKAFKKGWKNSNFSFLGASLAEKINTALRNIPWSKVKSVFKKIAKSIGTFINGFVKEMNWQFLGSSIAEGINTAVEFVDTLLTTIKWDKVGQALASSLDGFMNKFDFKGLGKTIGHLINAAASTAYNFVSNVRWGDLGTSLISSINSFLETVDFTTIGKTIGSALSGACAFIKNFISHADIKQAIVDIGNLIKGFFSEIDFGDVVPVLAGALSLKLSLLGGKIALGGIKDSILEFAKVKLAPTIFNAMSSGVNAAKDLTSKLVTSLSTKISTAVAEAGGSKAVLGSAGKIGVGICAAIVAGVAGFKLGEAIGKAITGQKTIDYKELLNPKDVIAGLKYGWNEEILPWINKNIVGKVSSIVKKIKAKLKPFTDFIKGLKKLMGIKDDVPDTKPKPKPKQENSYVPDESVTKNLGDFAKTGTKTIKIQADDKDYKNKIANDTKDGTKNFKFNADTTNVDNATSEAKSTVNKPVKYTANTTDVDTATHEATKGVTKGIKLTMDKDSKRTLGRFQEEINKHPLGVPVTMKVNGKKKKLELHFEKDTSSSNFGYVWATPAKKHGGLFKNGAWSNVTKYANGGLPGMGQMFVAREAGPELVGKIGSSTAVVNNDQIVSSVSDGVFKAVSAAMANQGSGIPQVNVYVGDKQVTDFVIKDVRGRTIATGRNPILA